MSIVQEKKRDQGGKIPPKRGAELVAATLEINRIYKILEEIQNNIDPVRFQRLNLADYRIAGERVNALVMEAKRDIYKFLLLMQSAGVDIEPTER